MVREQLLKLYFLSYLHLAQQQQKQQQQQKTMLLHILPYGGLSKHMR